MARVIIYLLWAGLVSGLVYVGTVYVGTAHARRGLAPTQLVIARSVVGECNFSTSNCSGGVMHTLARRWKMVTRLRIARGNRKTYSLALMFFQYCAVFRGPHRGRNRWVRGLPDYPGPPDGWPRSARWDRHEPHWHRIYLQAGLFLRGLVPDPCDGEPVHTGGLMDAARMSPHKWAKVDCGDTGDQVFWEAR